MTIEEYERAGEIITKIRGLDDEIFELKHIMSNNVGEWRLEVRASPSFSPHIIDHCGMLPEFLDKILREKIAQRADLTKRLREI